MTRTLNAAQKMTAAWLGIDPDWFTSESARIAVEQTGQMAIRYKAPHAHRGTPPRRKRQASGSLLPRLFKGHRP